MRERLVVEMDSRGAPAARVASTHLWELVEYLSCQRVAVLYRYEPDSFVVSFPRLELAAAQQTLDEWAASQAEMAA